MSDKFDEFAAEVCDECLRQGNLNGQRWTLDRVVVARMARDRFGSSAKAPEPAAAETTAPEPAPKPKKKTTKKATTKKGGDDGAAGDS